MIRPAVAASAALLAGFAELSLELAAVRLFAPHFGDSAPVWTNVIGVMLAALAVGAWLGGRLADRASAPAWLVRLLLGAGALAAVAPLLAGTLADALVPADLPLDSAMGTLVGGSLAGTLLLFAPPVLLAGAVTPLLVSSLHRGGTAVGRASGTIATWSILGGLLGTFSTTHVLIPGIGSRATVWTAALALGLAGLACLVATRGSAGSAGDGKSDKSATALGGALLVLLALGAVTLVGQGAVLRPPADGETVVAESESRYQYLQVVDTPAFGESGSADYQPATRVLRINEGLDSFHSVQIEGSPWAGAGRYYDWHALVPWLAGDGARPPDLKVLSLGAAAGTFERILRYVHPAASVDSVEIDPAVVALGRDHFGAFAADDPTSRVYAGLDARVFVERSTEQWDVVLVDAYERQMYVPAHVASVEFFRAVEARLRDGGVVSVNVGGLSFEDPVLRTIAGTMAAVFGQARALRVPGSRNFVVVARRRLGIDPTVLTAVQSEDSILEGMLRIAESDARWRRFRAPEDGAVLHDDRPFLDQLQESAYAGSEAADPVRIDGDIALDDSVAAVQGAAAAQDWDQVLEHCAAATEESAWLRLMAGDARWRRGDYYGARAEYLRGQSLIDPADETETAVGAALEGRAAAVAEPVARLDAASESAARNSWIAFAVALVLGLLCLGARRATRPAAG